MTTRQEDLEGRYFQSFDTLRVICIISLILVSFGLPIPFFDYLRPYFSAATGILFTLYGFLVLRDGADLRKNIKHTAKVFAILFAVYGLITMGYLWFSYGKPFMYFNKRGIFNFVVLNFWGENICSTIWYVQSTLYALIILWLLRGLKNLDWLFCLLLFTLAVVIGELAKVVNFSFLGNDYISGNFLTRTIPYMLLGRLIYRFYDRLTQFGVVLPWGLIMLGLVLSVIEHVTLFIYGKLGYTNHFIGFIPIAMGACLVAVMSRDRGNENNFAQCAKKMYKPMYYIFSPLFYALITAALFFCRTLEQYYYCNLFAGLAVLVITFGGCFLYAKLALLLEQRAANKAEAQKRLEELEDDE